MAPDPAGATADGGDLARLRRPARARRRRSPLPGPPALDSAQYAADFAEVRDYGGHGVAAHPRADRDGPVPHRRPPLPTPRSDPRPDHRPRPRHRRRRPHPGRVRRQPGRRRHLLLAQQARVQVLAADHGDRPRRHRQQPGHQRCSRLDTAAAHPALPGLSQRPRLLRRRRLRDRWTTSSAPDHSSAPT